MFNTFSDEFNFSGEGQMDKQTERPMDEQGDSYITF